MSLSGGKEAEGQLGMKVCPKAQIPLVELLISPPCWCHSLSWCCQQSSYIIQERRPTCAIGLTQVSIANHRLGGF